MFFKLDLCTGYPKIKKKRTKKKRSYLSSLILISRGRRASPVERFIKLLIYIALRLVIRPRKWRYPEKNYEIIDRTYKRIMSADFIFIPSSIAFYIVMAFIPVLSIITLIFMIPGIGAFISIEEVNGVLSDFIPGIGKILMQIEGSKIEIGGGFTIAISLLTTTWIASGGFSKLIYTQSYIYEHKFFGGYWMNKIKGMVMVLALTIFMLFALVINILVNRSINDLNVSVSSKKALTYCFLVFGLLFLVFFGMIGLFKFSPRFKISIKHVVPGAMVTALPTTFFLALIGKITTLWSYGNYGVIGAIMYLGMASLIISNFIFVGLISNAAYYKTFVSLNVQKKWTISKK